MELHTFFAWLALAQPARLVAEQCRHRDGATAQLPLPVAALAPTAGTACRLERPGPGCVRDVHHDGSAAAPVSACLIQEVFFLISG